MGGDFGAVPVAGTVVVAVVERLGGTVELTFRDEGGRERRVAFVEPLAFEVLSLLDVVLSGVAVSAQDPRIPAATGASHCRTGQGWRGSGWWPAMRRGCPLGPELRVPGPGLPLPEVR